MTQGDLADAAGVSLRSISNYESGAKYPRTHEVYERIAKALAVDVNNFFGEDNEFVMKAREKYGSRGSKQAEELILSARGLFAGGQLSEEDKDTVMQALQNVYWEAKAENKAKYTPKKYRGKNEE